MLGAAEATVQLIQYGTKQFVRKSTICLNFFRISGLNGNGSEKHGVSLAQSETLARSDFLAQSDTLARK